MHGACGKTARLREVMRAVCVGVGGFVKLSSYAQAAIHLVLWVCRLKW